MVFLAKEIKAAAEDHFDKHVVCAVGCADADAEIKFPIGVEIKINAGNELLFLLTQRIEARDESIRGIVFEAACNFLGEVVAHFHAGFEDETLGDARAVKTAL